MVSVLDLYPAPSSFWIICRGNRTLVQFYREPSRMNHMLPVESDTATRARARSRRPVILTVIGILGLAVIVAGVLYLKRPLASHVAANVSVAAALPGEVVTVQGRVTPVKAGRVVTLAQSGAAASSLMPSATSDEAGRFSLTYRLVEAPGADRVVLRIQVEKSGRFNPASSPSMTVLLLRASTATATAPSTVARGKTFQVTGSVVPGAQGRSVTTQESGDGTTWVTVGASARTGTDGAFRLSISASLTGALRYRAVVERDTKFGQSISNPVSVSVEDIKAAGAFYLAAVAPANEGLDRFGQLTKDYSVGLPKLRAGAHGLSVIYRAFADKLAGNQWPKAAQPAVNQLVQELTSNYDTLNMAAVATTIVDYDTQLTNFYSSSNSAASTVRQVLGLPARPVS